METKHGSRIITPIEGQEMMSRLKMIPHSIIIRYLEHKGFRIKRPMKRYESCPCCNQKMSKIACEQREER